ncbi:hypothetical protein [Halobacteriovorax sp.]|uniref:hypothetical protein n=1 Tax=Halobacteriovorax sp. TaxID=2020862 RepID=UPI0035667CB7
MKFVLLFISMTAVSFSTFSKEIDTKEKVVNRKIASKMNIAEGNLANHSRSSYEVKRFDVDDHTCVVSFVVQKSTGGAGTSTFCFRK